MVKVKKIDTVNYISNKVCPPVVVKIVSLKKISKRYFNKEDKKLVLNGRQPKLIGSLGSVNRSLLTIGYNFFYQVKIIKGAFKGALVYCLAEELEPSAVHCHFLKDNN